MTRMQNFKAGLLKDNPVFSLYLGICSTLAIALAPGGTERRGKR